MAPIEEMLFVLPPDVVIVPVASLAPSYRSQIEWREGDFAVGRARMRRPAKVLDADSTALLEQFRSPSRITDAVFRHSQTRRLDACATLEESFAALQSLVAGELLVPAETVAGVPPREWFGAGMTVDRFDIRRLVQSLDD